MEKDRLGEQLSISGKRHEEHVEVSSTGYGLESVSSEDTEQTEEKNTSCGGL